jgi:hypothetical protein
LTVVHKPVARTSALEEIVEEIVVHLRPWKRGLSEAAVTADVNHELDVLLKLVPLNKQLADRTAIRQHARKLDETLGKVETLLASAPDTLAVSLFNPLPPLVIDLNPDAEYPLLQPCKSIEEIERSYRACRDPFIAELRRLRKVCARAIEFGSHPNYDHAKHLCAHFAHGLMQGLSDKKITGTQDSAFRTIASLLYQAVSGQRRAGLKRACDARLNWPPRLGTD